jgi:DNA-binding NarL/FixJ family response regulator
MSGEGRPITVLVADDHALFREGIASILSCETDMTLVAEATGADEAVRLFRIHRPDVTLMDLQMQDVSGIAAITAIRAEHPEARIIVLTTYKGDARILRALKAGARAYLLKTSLRRELLDTIRAIHTGFKRIPPDVASELADHAGDDPLTARELDVLQLVAAGLSNRAVAAHLSVAEGTVKEHMKNIMSKLAADDRTHAVTTALRRGIIEL